jgi:recombination protein RecA
MAKTDRLKQLEMAIHGIQQRYGTLALVRGRPLSFAGEGAVPHISTGFAALDEALGIGGLAQGRLTEILGPATSGKTTLALQFLAQAQANGGVVGYIDLARTLDPDYAYRCGLDLERLAIFSPDNLPEALAMTDITVANGALSALVFDAPDALWRDSTHALAGTLDHLMAPLHRAGTALVFLHVPVAPMTCGLRALAHYASMRLYVTRERWLRHYENIQGCEVRVEIVKNRLAAASRAATVAISFTGTRRG